MNQDDLRVLRRADDYYCARIDAQGIARLSTCYVPNQLRPELAATLAATLALATPIADVMRAYCVAMIEYSPAILDDNDVVIELTKRCPQLSEIFAADAGNEIEFIENAKSMAQRIAAWIDVLRLVIIARAEVSPASSPRSRLRDVSARRTRRL